MPSSSLFRIDDVTSVGIGYRNLHALGGSGVVALSPPNHCRPVLRAGVGQIVDDPFDSFGVRAVCAAVERTARLDTVADHLAAAVLTHGRQSVNRTFEAVEDMRLAGSDDLKRQVVIVATYFAPGHVSPAV
jgi:hypothetical protein